jgi:lauroyl/myristoyl acyltransferase
MQSEIEVSYRRYLLAVQAASLVLPPELAYRGIAAVAPGFSPRRIDIPHVARHAELCLAGTGLNIDAACRDYLDNAAVNHLNTYLYRAMDESWLERKIVISGAWHLRQAYARGKGVLVLSGHQHSLMLLGVTIGLMNYPINAILMDPAVSVPPFLSHYADRAFQDSSRHYNGGRYFYVNYGKSYARPIYRALQAGQVVVSANDFPKSLAPKRRLPISFFNKQISCPTGSVEIALNCQSTILSAFIRWVRGRGFIVSFNPVMDSGDLPTIMKAYGAELEAAVFQDPGGWEGWKWPDLLEEV